MALRDVTIRKLEALREIITLEEASDEDLHRLLVHHGYHVETAVSVFYERGLPPVSEPGCRSRVDPEAGGEESGPASSSCALGMAGGAAAKRPRTHEAADERMHEQPDVEDGRTAEREFGAELHLQEQAMAALATAVASRLMLALPAAVAAAVPGAVRDYDEADARKNSKCTSQFRCFRQRPHVLDVARLH